MRSLTFLAIALPMAFAAPIINPKEGVVIPGKYIVKMKPGVVSSLVQTVVDTLAADADIKFDMENFKGFAAALSDSDLALVTANPNVCSSHHYTQENQN